MSECGCYHGLDCTKISVCHSETVIEELEAELKRMKGINKQNGDHAEYLQSQLAAIRPYIQHREACTIYDPMVKGEVCTCGLESAIGERAALSAGLISIYEYFRRVSDG